MTSTKREFLLNEAPHLLKTLEAATEPRFGLMTAQHMVEHILGDSKFMTSRLGEPEGPPTEKQLGFQKFIDNGAMMKHRPSTKTKADLPDLKYATLKEAIAEIEPVTQHFYQFFDKKPDFKPYNKFMGELSFEQVETFFSQHWRYHFWQFKLIDSFP